ncbi:MAG: DnaB-like helicase C-terminal domain-containing protein [Lentisphaeria bacterium]|jgi:replicative DNA helicase
MTTTKTSDPIIEQSIIGAILIDPNVNFDFVTSEGVTVESFTLEAHKGIFAAMQTLAKEGKPLDMTTISSRSEAGPGAFDCLLACHARVVTTVHLPTWIERLKELECRRVVSKGAMKLVQGADGGMDTDALLAMLPEIEATARAKKGRVGLLSTEELCDSLSDKIGKPTVVLPLFSDSTDAERKIQLHPGELMTVGGKSGEGKTALAAGMAFNLLRKGCAILYICTESSSEDIAARLAGYEARVAHYDALGPFSTEERRGRFAEAVALCKSFSRRLSIIGSEHGLITPDVIEAGIRRCKAQNGHCDAVFVDFIQGVKAPPEMSRQSSLFQTNFCIEALHNALLRHQAAGIVLSQYNRQGTFSGGPPTMDWLKDSSLLAQLSHTVAFLIRGGEKNPGEALFKSEKTRNQKPFSVVLSWNGSGYHSSDSLAWPDSRRDGAEGFEDSDF